MWNNLLVEKVFLIFVENYVLHIILYDMDLRLPVILILPYKC